MLLGKSCRLSFVILLAHCTNAVAADDLFSMSLDQLESIKVNSSTLFEDTIANAPSSVSIFTHDDIRRLGFERLTQLISFVPGYQTYSSDNSSAGQTYSARNYSTGDTCPEILILLDGQRINTDRGGGISSSNYDLWLDNVERVEFIRGPGSAIYGSNALQGVINIVTGGNRQLKLIGGNNGQQHISGQWNFQEKNNALNVYMRHEDRNGEALTIYDPAILHALETKNPYDDSEVYLNGKAGGFSAKARWTQLNNEKYYVGGRVSNDWNSLDSETHYVELGYDYFWLNQFTLETNLFQSGYKTLARSMPVPNPMLLYYTRLQESEVGISQRLRFEDTKNRALLGWESRRPEIIHSDSRAAGFVNTSAILLPETARTIRGVYTEWQHQWTGSSNLLLGTRYDDYSDFGTHLSPRAAWVNQLNSRDTLKLMYAEAFRAPTRSEVGFQNNSGFKGNPDLKPETAKMTELAWVRTENEQLFSATLYHLLLADEIVRDSLTPKSWFNGKNVSWNGLELEWQIRQGNWFLRSTASAAFNNEIKNNNQSKNLFSVIFGYSGNKWDATLTNRYQDSQTQTYSENSSGEEKFYRRLGGRSLYGAQYNYQWRPQLTLFLHADNIFNRQFYAPADISSVNPEGVPQPGTALLAGLKWTL